MQETILIVYLVVAIALVGIILLQQGKGAEMGASFGAGGANTVFGAAGSGNVLTKTTTILAILFFAIALSISYLNSEPEVVSDAVLDQVTTEQAVETPAIEEQLPLNEGGVEAEVAPELKAPVTAHEQTKAVSEKRDEQVKKDELTKKDDPAKKDGSDD